MRLLERKERKQFLSLLQKQFGFSGDLDYAFFINEQKKVFIVNKEVDDVLHGKVRIQSVGLYIAEWSDHHVRLSIEGSQLLGDGSTSVMVTDAEARAWMKGNDVEKDVPGKGFVIIKNGSDYLGSGKIGKGVVYNYIGKNRRLQVSD